MLHKP